MLKERRLAIRQLGSYFYNKEDTLSWIASIFDNCHGNIFSRHSLYVGLNHTYQCLCLRPFAKFDAFIQLLTKN
jgi:hypothetical protein